MGDGWTDLPPDNTPQPQPQFVLPQDPPQKIPSPQDPEYYGVRESDPRYLGCGVLLAIVALATLVLLLAAANAARTPSPDTQSALLGNKATAAGASGPPQPVPPTDTPEPVTELPMLALAVGATPAPAAAPPTAVATPAATAASTPVPTQPPTQPPATEPPTPEPTTAPPQNCVATTITVTEGGSSETVTGTGSNTDRTFHFSMTGTQATIQANDNPRCSPPHYNVYVSATDGSYTRNCGPPVNSNTTTFKDSSPAEEVTVQITEVAQC